MKLPEPSSCCDVRAATPARVFTKPVKAEKQWGSPHVNAALFQSVPNYKCTFYAFLLLDLLQRQIKIKHASRCMHTHNAHSLSARSVAAAGREQLAARGGHRSPEVTRDISGHIFIYPPHRTQHRQAEAPGAGLPSDQGNTEQL